MNSETTNQDQPASENGTKDSIDDLFTPGGFRKTEGTSYSRPLDKPNKNKSKSLKSGGKVVQKPL
ncbi:hypothetical protein MUK70_10190 [Dyadobacter chenwenxiniae]|uniref:Uncharacterized protein n=1 Tax=Dyadobacter chenwenxiniae TaxID=2906456 RepID=A0A9X1TG40_9BACT|nr:hypothetical protein [Dyadobacter chenwenxiniae]MCF0052618.1 hypothetical protein [Dyadobacter chenwenxiniae]MCF0063265.1 hypothetical protein [Dyadobacter chenwenxiniae]UON85355.1 hypothetical protein MUK70_10190 [Dyadobacter chenwenxiniae]